MKIKKSWMPVIGIVGILFVMMTAASVSAERTIDTAVDTTDEGGEPVLIATEDTDDSGSRDLPDYENYTGDMVISPGPSENSEVAASVPLPTLVILGVVVLIGLAGVGILIKRKQNN